MNIQSHQEATDPGLRVTPCFADSMAHSVSTNCRDPSFVHLATEPRLPIRDYDQALDVHETFYFQALKKPKIQIVHTKGDLEADDKIRVLLGMRYVPDHMTLPRVGILHSLGVRVLSLAYKNYPTPYGDNSGGCGKLTHKGMELLEWMNDYGIVLDLTGTGNKTACDACRFILENNFSMIPIASHSGCYSVSRDTQDLTDVLLNIIALMNGYVGIPHEYPEEFMLHAIHASNVMRMIGTGTIGVCSDRGYSSYFGMVADLEGQNLHPDIFGRNFLNVIEHSLPQS